MTTAEEETAAGRLLPKIYQGQLVEKIRKFLVLSITRSIYKKKSADQKTGIKLAMNCLGRGVKSEL